ncbi:MAG: aldose 1-epimerase [Alkalispirochaeta sp.]
MIRISEPSGCSAQIDPSCGGTVRQIRLPEDVLYDPERSSGCDTAFFAGRVLLPFADRISNGRYRWRGTDYTLPLNDPEMGDAIHGFLYRTALKVESRAADRLTLRGELSAEQGYPWPLTVKISYRVAAATFFIAVEAQNRGASCAPFTAGWHPYFDFGREAELQIRASRFIEADDALRVTGRRPFVDGTRYDFRRRRPIGEDPLDVAVELDDAHEHSVVLTDSRRSLTITPTGVFSRIQIFTPPGDRGIALEPVSAPGAAFNDPPLGVTELEPGASVTGSVAIRCEPRRVPPGPPPPPRWR